MYSLSNYIIFVIKRETVKKVTIKRDGGEYYLRIVGVPL